MCHLDTEIIVCHGGKMGREGAGANPERPSEVDGAAILPPIVV